MDAFESLIAMLLKRDGFWTTTSFKVDLTKAEKREVGKPSLPRPEIDVLAYRGATNHLLVVECKSFLDSTGVHFAEGTLQPPKRYKLFSDSTYRKVVLRGLKRQCVKTGFCRPDPTVELCLAAGHVANRIDRAALGRNFDDNQWRLFDEEWVIAAIKKAAKAGYENDVAHVVAKIILRRRDI